MSFRVKSLAIAAVLMVAAAGVRAEADELFPPATPGCFVGAEVMPAAAGAAAYKPPPGVSAIRLERSFPQLAFEETRDPPNADGRLVSVRMIVTFADAGKNAVKRFENGRWDIMRCKDAVCDAGNYRIEREADGSVLLKMTGGVNVGGGEYGSSNSRRLPDGRVYRLSAKAMSACR